MCGIHRFEHIGASWGISLVNRVIIDFGNGLTLFRVHTVNWTSVESLSRVLRFSDNWMKYKKHIRPKKAFMQIGALVLQASMCQHTSCFRPRTFLCILDWTCCHGTHFYHFHISKTSGASGSVTGCPCNVWCTGLANFPRVLSQRLFNDAPPYDDLYTFTYIQHICTF